jgi:metal-sulfur cluster biosynthetic enzyme
MKTTPTEYDIREALKVCFDPELAVNIVDLGLVEHIAIVQDHEAPGFEPRYILTIQLLKRTQDEEREAMLTGQIRNRLAGIPAISRSEVQVLSDPTWTPDRMTPAARQQLGLDRAPKQGLITIKL